MKYLVLLPIIIILVSCSTEESNGPKISVDPTTKDFGTEYVGSTSSAINFTIKNTGSETLNVSNITLIGSNKNDFVLSAALPMSINESSTSNFTVKFKPTAIGNRNTTLEITHNAPDTPLKISLSGTGEYQVIYEDDFSVTGLWSISHGSNSSGSASWVYDIGNNTTGGDGRFIIADSQANSSSIFDEYITSPQINCSTYLTGTIKLEFDGNYQDERKPSSLHPLHDYAAIVIYDQIHFTTYTVDKLEDDWNVNGEHRSYDISAFVRQALIVKIGFYYFGSDDGWFSVDNVKLVHIP